jgi:hypothetical protein
VTITSWGDNVLDYAGNRGFGITQTCRCDRFPEGLKEYLHHEVVNAGDPRPKAMRFEKPIVAIKQVQARENAGGERTTKPYTKTLVSFQSTGATNICSINNIPSVTCTCQLRGEVRGQTGDFGGLNKTRPGQPTLGIIMVLTMSTIW